MCVIAPSYRRAFRRVVDRNRVPSADALRTPSGGACFPRDRNVNGQDTLAENRSFLLKGDRNRFVASFLDFLFFLSEILNVRIFDSLEIIILSYRLLKVYVMVYRKYCLV